MAEVGQQFGPYLAVSRLGSGGMAETFVGRRLGLGGLEQRVCLKVIRDRGLSSDAERALFVREAATAALLRHSNIVAMVDVVEGGAALVLELVEGADLRTILARLPQHRMREQEAVWVAIELCKALDYAHTRTLHGKPHGIVHRDISPANVMISYAGEVKLADFGIAKSLGRGVEMPSTVRGKLGYMAPEQAAGWPVDGRSDLFALGVVLYEMLCGQRPFDGAGEHATLQRAAAEQYPAIAERSPLTSAGLAAIVTRLLKPKPMDRFQSAEELLAALFEYAPAPDTYRALGAAAAQARPHQTLLTGALPAPEDLAALPSQGTTSPRGSETVAMKTGSAWGWLIGLSLVAAASFGALLWLMLSTQ